MPILEWTGKEKVINHHHLEVPYRVRERQYSFDKGDVMKKTTAART
jgi:adenine-specific DNA-methyltransferase